MARVPGAEAAYAVAVQFRDHCLREGRSLLWPNERVWTLEHLDSLWSAFAANPDPGEKSFFEKWELQLADQAADVHRVAADLMVIYSLFPRKSTLGAARKSEYISIVREWKDLPTPDRDAGELVSRAFMTGIATAGIYYLTGMPYHVAFYLQFSREAIRRQADLTDWQVTAELADSTRQFIMNRPEFRGDTIAGRNILLHLLFPDRYEAWASQRSKERVVAALGTEAGVRDDDDIDEALMRIRQHLSTTLGKQDFQFWDDDIAPLWEGPKDEKSTSATRIESIERVDATVGAAPSLQTLIDATYLSEATLTDIVELLEEKKQLIFEGPPGSGKTWVADKVARWITGNPMAGEPNDRVEIVQFHQSYAYEDFVQGIRPVTGANGQLTYEVRDGVFKQLCERAFANPDTRFVLLIDEINRGNISRIFGELLLLLEYRESKARLPYDSSADPYLRIPENLYLIGTMNTADRSLAQIDYALRRRFYFVRFMPVVDGHAGVLERWLETQEIDEDSRRYVLRLFVALNTRISGELSDDYQIGHSYFMQDDIGIRSRIDRIWDRAVMPLLEEYFYHQRHRDEVLAELRPDVLVPLTPDAEAMPSAMSTPT